MPASEPEAFLNGRFVPQSAAVVPVYDAGFVQGATVAEQLRTFGGQLFRLEEHLARLAHSLEIMGAQPELSLEQIGEAAVELARRNHRLLPPDDDLNLAMFVTPGPYPAMAPAGAAGPTVCMHTFPIPFRLWAEKYEHGESLVTTPFLQTPPGCWPPELKCRSRMHYYLADRAARARQPGARALMLDADGYITEATTANLAIYRGDDGICSPPHKRILPGISLAVLEELAMEISAPWTERDLRPEDLAQADEAWLSSTSPCLLPVTRFNGLPIADGRPGPIFQKLIARWGEMVGLDIAGQAKEVARRR